MSAKTPRVWETYLEDPQQPAQPIPLDTPAWFGWLEAPTTRRFTYPVFDRRVGYIVGFMTLRKERRQRGGEYWVAYRRCQGQLRKVYLGAAVRLTRAGLDRLAQTFLAADQRHQTADGTDGDSN